MTEAGLQYVVCLLQWTACMTGVSGHELHLAVRLLHSLFLTFTTSKAVAHTHGFHKFKSRGAEEMLTKALIHVKFS